MIKKATVFFLTVLFLIPSIQADRRKYVWAYQYATIAPGKAEMEFYQTTKLDTINSWEYRIDIEHGLTPKWDLSIYQIFTQNEGESFKWDAFQIRTRYRLAKSGEYFFDPLFYLEYNRKVDLKKQNKLEAKLILGRNINRINIAINPVYELSWAPGNLVHEPGLNIGLSYEISNKFSIGVESSSRIKYQKNENNKTSSYLGPTISLGTGPINYAVGYVLGLTNNSNDARVRFLMGVDL